MKKPKLQLACAVIVLAMSTAPALAEQYYKWVDDQGVTHYSSEKPEGREASKVRAHNPPSSSQDKAMKRLEEQRQEAAQEREAANQDEEDEGSPTEAIKEECKKHRENLKILTNKPTVRRKNPETGQMEVLTQEEKQKMIERTKKQLERCNQMNAGSGDSE